VHPICGTNINMILRVFHFIKIRPNNQSINQSISLFIHFLWQHSLSRNKTTQTSNQTLHKSTT